MDNTITYKVGSLVLPGSPLTELGMSWRPDQVSCKVVPESLGLPLEIEALSRQVLEIKRPTSNDRVYHYRRAEVSADELRLEVGYSSYQYTLLHSAFEPVMIEEHPEIQRTLLEHIRKEDLFDLGKLGGPLSSGVGITTVVVTSDRQTVMVHRSPKVALNANLNHPAMAEGVNFNEGEDGLIDLASVAIRSAVEELNLPIKREDLLFLGLNVDGRYWWPGISARVRVPLTFSEVKELSANASDVWERSGELRSVLYTPEGIAEELRQAMDLEKGMTGFGAIALLHAGSVDFSHEAMERACR